MLNNIVSIADYQTSVAQYSSIKRYSNDYIQTEAIDLIEKENLYEYHTISNLFLFVKKEIGYRMYYYLGNLDEIADFSNIHDVVVEILYRGERFYPRDEIDYFLKCGFSINLIRDQYCGLYKDLSVPVHVSDIMVDVASNIADVSQACDLFNASFDQLSGDFISKKCYDQLLANKQILIAKDLDGNFLGALHQTIEKGVAWVSHVAVLPESRGKHVGQMLLDTFVTQNCSSEKQRYMFWVQQQNKAAINMYVKKGFKYLNKSTISLIK